MHFQYMVVPIHDTAESVLSDTEFRERTTGERFEEIVGITPFGVDNLVQFRDDAVLDVSIEAFELIERRWDELPGPVLTVRHRRSSIQRPRRGLPAHHRRLATHVRSRQSASIPRV